MGKVAKRRNEFEGRLRKVEAKFCCRFIRLSTVLVKMACMDRIFCAVVEQYVTVFDGLVNPLGGELVNSLQADLKRVYSDNSVNCPVSLTHVSGASATSVFWRSDS